MNKKHIETKFDDFLDEKFIKESINMTDEERSAELERIIEINSKHKTPQELEDEINKLYEYDQEFQKTYRFNK